MSSLTPRFSAAGFRSSSLPLRRRDLQCARQILYNQPTKNFSLSRVARQDISEVKVSDRLSLEGKSVLVTGGGRGIGFAICKAVAQQGGNVAVLDALSEPVEEFHSLESKYGIKTFFQRADVTKEDSLAPAFAAAVDKIGPFQGCVPAAGIALDKPIEDTTWEEAMAILHVNVLGTWGTAKTFAKHAAEHGQGGSIVMIASIAAQGIKVPEQNLAIYNMSKAAVKGVVGPLAVELAEKKIRVNSISPGVILSPMTNALKTQYPKLYVQDPAFLNRSSTPANTSCFVESEHVRACRASGEDRNTSRSHAGLHLFTLRCIKLYCKCETKNGMSSVSLYP